jgi:hypothetical protein
MSAARTCDRLKANGQHVEEIMLVRRLMPLKECKKTKKITSRIYKLKMIFWKSFSSTDHTKNRNNYFLLQIQFYLWDTDQEWRVVCIYSI